MKGMEMWKKQRKVELTEKRQRRKKGKLRATLAPPLPHLSPPPNCPISNHLPSDSHYHSEVAIVCFLLLSPVGMLLRCLFPFVWTVDSLLFGPFGFLLFLSPCCRLGIPVGGAWLFGKALSTDIWWSCSWEGVQDMTWNSHAPVVVGVSWMLWSALCW